MSEEQKKADNAINIYCKGSIIKKSGENFDFFSRNGNIFINARNNVKIWGELNGHTLGINPTFYEPLKGFAKITDAYFAKYVDEKTTEKGGGITCTFKNPHDFKENPETLDANAEHILKNSSDIKNLAEKNEYITLDLIKDALKDNVYKAEDTAKIDTYKIKKVLKKIDDFISLEDKVYLVAKFHNLDGQSTTITISEKEGLFTEKADALLSFLELTEKEMEQDNVRENEENEDEEQEVPGEEKTEFIATIENGIVKIPLHIRPKNDEDLEKWKEKLTEGIEDGTYNYKVGKTFTVENDKELDTIANNIFKRAKEGTENNDKIKEGYFAKIEDIKNSLKVGETYESNSTINFSTYKNSKQLVYIKVKTQKDGTNYHEEIYKNEKKHFEIKRSNCFCNRDLTMKEVETIFKSKKLFTASNCPLPQKQRNYKDFTNALKKTMKEHDITTCLRKAHFLAQIQIESDNLGTTLEYATGWDYDHTTHEDGYKKYLLFKKDPEKHKDYGEYKIKRQYNRYKECIKHGHDVKGYGPKYKGRGFLQLTWKDTYQAYFDFVNDELPIDKPEIVAENITYACDSSGWFWRYHSAWGDLNNAADRDDVYYINIGVNGGFNHFSERINNLKGIIKTMKINESCSDIKDLDKKVGVYKFSTSKIKDSNYGKRNKSKFEEYDDK